MCSLKNVVYVLKNVACDLKICVSLLNLCLCILKNVVYVLKLVACILKFCFCLLNFLRVY